VGIVGRSVVGERGEKIRQDGSVLKAVAGSLSRTNFGHTRLYFFGTGSRAIFCGDCTRQKGPWVGSRCLDHLRDECREKNLSGCILRVSVFRFRAGSYDGETRRLVNWFGTLFNDHQNVLPFLGVCSDIGPSPPIITPSVIQAM